MSAFVFSAMAFLVHVDPNAVYDNASRTGMRLQAPVIIRRGDYMMHVWEVRMEGTTHLRVSDDNPKSWSPKEEDSVIVKSLPKTNTTVWMEPDPQGKLFFAKAFGGEMVEMTPGLWEEMVTKGEASYISTIQRGC